MDRLTEIVKYEVDQYNEPCFNCESYAALDDEHKVYVVYSTIAQQIDLDHTSIVIAAHIRGDLVIIDHDSTNRPLVDALVQAGIPREKIILAYDGEAIPNETIYEQTVS